MSRARNLKPAFFKNEDLADLPFEFRILFQGLWCLADREGRLEDRPKRIKVEVFPYDAVDVNDGLSRLQDAGFISRYEADGIQYIQVLMFTKHQNPHCKESASTIPAPCQHGAGTKKSGTSRADSLNPLTDSLNPPPEKSMQATASPSPAGLACRLMKSAGCASTNSSHPDLLAALAEGVTAEALAATVSEAVEQGIGKPFAWAIATARGRNREGAKPLPTGSPNHGRPQQLGKTAQGIGILEEMKRGLAGNRDLDGVSEAALPRLGAPTRR